MDGDGDPVILWNGYREANSRETYVTMVPAKESSFSKNIVQV